MDKCGMNWNMETIKKYLKKENIALNLEGETREDVYMELLSLLSKRNEIRNKEKILKSLIAQDERVDAHRGKGVVIARISHQHQKRIALCLGLKRNGLDEEVFDRERSKIFVLIITPESGNEECISLISEISSLLNQGSVREDILETGKSEKVFKILVGQ
jgi:mannitol/fructose-specific phosphotransferase system IIA component (Ntr-type)